MELKEFISETIQQIALGVKMLWVNVKV